MLNISTRSALLLCALALAPTAASAAAVETILYSFSGTGISADGALPIAGLLMGPDRSLYGTTTEGGGATCNCGTVFRLVPPAAGQTLWTYSVLHSFTGYPLDGASPYASLIFDPAGNLYGTTLLGGLHEYGTVFTLTPSSGGSGWDEHVLHSFAGTADGAFPQANLTFDAAGNLYGTASLGGAEDQGTLFELTPNGTAWTLDVLHAFAGGADGALPRGGVIFDAAGDLYGTTTEDGVTGIAGGTAFKFTPAGTETVLHTFTDRVIGMPFDGGMPSGPLLFDAAGNLYGTTEVGGGGQVIVGEASNAGTVYRLAPPQRAQGTWTETLLHSFNGDGKDGSTPVGGVTFDSSGSLYGVTAAGGRLAGGTAFRMTKSAASPWPETVLHNFSDSPDGGNPQGGLITDGHGNFFGVTLSGTASATSRQVGTVFELTP